MKGFLNADTLAVIYGESGCGKSFFTLDLALRVALGWKWRDRRVRRGGVVYVAAEGGRGLAKRIEAFRQKHRDELRDTGTDRDTPGHHRDISKLSRCVPFTLITTVPTLGADGDETDALIAEIKAAEQRTGEPVRLVVLDTLSRCFGGGDENSSEAMGSFVRNCDRIRQATGACVLIVHHAGKDTTKGARGHSLLRAAVDTEMLIEAGRDTGTDGTLADCPAASRAKITKQKDGEGAEFGFQLRQVTLGMDQDGDPVTSCVIEETDAPTRKATRMSDRDKLAVEALRTLVIEEGVKLPAVHVFRQRDSNLELKCPGIVKRFTIKCSAGHPGTLRRRHSNAPENAYKPLVSLLFPAIGYGCRDTGTHRDIFKLSRRTQGRQVAGTPGHVSKDMSRVPSRPGPNQRKGDVVKNRPEPTPRSPSERIISLASRVRRLTPDRHDPERFHVEKNEVVNELRRLARALAS